MLAHDNLEEFGDPANYDLEEAPGSQARIGFYGDLVAQAGGPVLELACGSGLVTLAVAARGLDVTGVDIARPMLAHAHAKARQQGLHVNWIEADARAFDLGRRFRAIYLTGNAFQAFLSREDQARMLACVKRHTETNAVFAFETRNPSGHDLNDQPEEEFWQSYTSVQGHRVTVSGKQRFDAPAQVMHWTTCRRWNDGEREHNRQTRIACRFTYPQELAALLRDNGLRIVEQFGDWDRTPVAANSQHLITICRV